MDLQTKVRETIQKYNMLSYGDGVLVAVSGGPDSVALLHLLSGLRDEWGLRLEVAHLQHGIRGEEARQDALFVAGMAESLDLPFHLKEVDLPGIRAEKGKGNLEAMGREERYHFFAAVAEKCGIHRVATAHTRDDQVETLLMWLLRGSGRRGLSGMRPVRQLHSSFGFRVPSLEFSKLESRNSRLVTCKLLVRPLIEASRQEIMSYLAANGLKYRTDHTNLSPGPLRNWIRLHLLPQLKERTDPHLDERLAQLADLLHGEEEILEQMARGRLQRVVQGEDLVRESLLQEGKAMQRRLIRLWLQATLGDLKGIGFRDVDEAIEFIARGPPQGRLSIPGGWDLVRQYETVRLEKRKRKREQPVEYSYTLPRDGELFIPEARMKIQSSRNSLLANARPENNLEALFDAAVLPEALTVRNFRAGDRFQPLGMRGHKKVKDLFIEKKVPRSVRHTLPLILAGGEILWIPRYGRSEVAKVGPETREVLRVKLVLGDGS
jgi:tRNA(Ile)-lysidine synthase